MASSTTMTPLALSLLGVEPERRRRRSIHAEGDAIPDIIQNLPEFRPVRISRRPTSYFNSFQTLCSPSEDAPPSYNVATHQQATQRRHLEGREILPKYTCSAAAEGKVLLQLESMNPLHGIGESEWREVYMVLQGTMLSFHRSKDNGPGKLLRKYTLQHAEVGLAVDTQHTVLVPQSRLAHLVPSAARRKAWTKDPDMFKPVRQHILRLRAETDQVIIADPSEERIHSLMHAIGAGIDVACAIDERSIPRQCTIPRRRRRRANLSSDLSDPILLAEQERILREMYPSLAGETEQARHEAERTGTAGSDDGPNDSTSTPARDEDELDLAAIREDGGSSLNRPGMIRQTTTTSVTSTYSPDMMFATAPSNFGATGKWQPQHPRTQQQTERYVRRCMPVLLADAVRASDIIVINGRRVKINWRMELLEEWQLLPPSYRSHSFDEPATGLERTRSTSQNSASGSANQSSEQTARSVNGSETEDQITPAVGLPMLDLSKVPTITSPDKGTISALPTPKIRDERSSSPDHAHGVIFCF